MVIILVAVLGFVAVAGFGFVFAGGEGDQARALKRAQTIVGRADERNPRARQAGSNQEVRRKQILKTLREQERQQKKARVTVTALMNRAGFNADARMFWIVSAVIGTVMLAVGWVVTGKPLIALGLGFAAGLGLPRWVVGMLGARRMGKFTASFSDAMDVIVRGIKSGLPVQDCLKIIARESPQPLADEFKRLVESLGMGMSVDQATDKMYERMPTTEVKFFQIVLSIQAKTGGNLAEALSNLSGVLRARKMMKEKIKALSSEAVASALIIGSLPPGVVLLICITSPTYMAPMFTDPRGHIMLMGGILWMATGIFVMRRMINFKF
ncbi:MAG: type II secretion system F family protein [Caulobacteraceae bacterium]|nr:type II secretion system F family protein [Caulobacteraceae bacterium]